MSDTKDKQPIVFSVSDRLPEEGNPIMTRESSEQCKKFGWDTPQWSHNRFENGRFIANNDDVAFWFELPSTAIDEYKVPS